ncbi:MAG: hypothetical protein NVV73_07865 [Cellvibrionaceae bacterium]|nr:hypothetical protein [Cellvibrionaceae bacterium]
MWTYETTYGNAKIIYDSLSGYFVALFNGSSIGDTYLTPQDAITSLSEKLRDSGVDVVIPIDMASWEFSSPAPQKNTEKLIAMYANLFAQAKQAPAEIEKPQD